MLFPPPGVKIRRTIETFFLPGTPTLIAEHDLKRVFLSVLLDQSVSVNIVFAGTPSGLATAVQIGNGYTIEAHFWGPEEVWALCSYPVSPPGGNILVQSVFYD